MEPHPFAGRPRGDAPGAQPPQGVPVHLDRRGGVPGTTASQAPPQGVPGRHPPHRGVAGDHELHLRPRGGSRVAQRVGQGAQERLQHRREELAVGQPGPPGRLAHLLLVGPVLGQLPRRVQPHRRGLQARPRHRRGVGVEVQLRPHPRDLAAGARQQLHQLTAAQAARGRHPLLVGAVDEGGEGLASGWAWTLVPVARAGQPPQVVVQDVGGDVLDRPTRARRRAVPLARKQAAEQVQERRPLPREERSHVDPGPDPRQLDHPAS
jgi:hypothetical protein